MRSAVASSEKQASPVVNWPRLQDLMQRSAVDLVVASTPANVTYLSDFWSVSHWTRRSAQVFAMAGRATHRNVGIVLPLGNADLIPTAALTAPDLVVCYDRFVFTTAAGGGRRLEPEEAQLLQRVAEHDGGLRSPIEALASAIQAVVGRGARIALEFDGLHHGDAERLEAALTDVSFVDAVPILRSARAIKTEAEVERLRSAATLSAKAFEEAAQSAQIGDTERDIERRFHAAIVQRDGVPFLTSITSGPRTALPNGQASDRVLQAGDGIRFDGGCRFRHYASDIARIAAFDGYSDKHRDYYRAVVSGLEAAAEAARPGVSGAQIFETAVDAVRRSGIPHYERSHCGHGIGIENYDAPRIAPDSADVLEPGMVICLETPYYEIGWGGVQAEDTYLVTDHGLEAFTTTPGEPLKAGTA